MPRKPKAAAEAARTVGRSPDYAWGFGAVGTGNDQFINSSLSNPFGLLSDMREMWLTDETCGAMSQCVMTAMYQLPWKFTPQVDGQDDGENPQAKAAADFCNTLLLDMQGSFADHVQNALAMLWGGFAPCEIVLKQRDGVKSRFKDMLWGIDKLPLRDPRTVIGWNYDSDQNLIAMRQMSIGTVDPIPMWKVLHYRMTAELDNPYGRPLMLPAHRIWRLKRKIQDSEAIGIERDLVGLPLMRIPKEVLAEAAEKDTETGLPSERAKLAQANIDAARRAVSDLRFNKTGGLVLWSNTYNEDEPVHPDTTLKWDFKIVTTGGQRSIDTRTAIRDYDRAMARVGLMQFLTLGDRSTGSFALSDDQSNMALRSFVALTWHIANEFNRKATPLVFDINRMDKTFLPQLRPGKISKEDGQKLGALLTGIGRSADLWSTDAEMRAELARMTELPFDTAAQRKAADTAQTAAEASALKPTFSAPGKASDFGGN